MASSGNQSVNCRSNFCVKNIMIMSGHHKVGLGDMECVEQNNLGQMRLLVYSIQECPGHDCRKIFDTRPTPSTKPLIPRFLNCSDDD